MANGRVTHEWGRVDDLFRVALKALIVNDKGEILVVKESGRTWWDLPGGGMDHGESLKEALSRELFEEVGLKGDLSYDILSVSEPHLLDVIDIIQVRLMFFVKPSEMSFSVGTDSDEIAFIEPSYFEKSDDPYDQQIYSYWLMAKGRNLV